MTRVDVDEGRIEVTEHGVSGRPPAVLLAGFSAPATSWRYQVPALVQAGLRVLTVDLPGHGTAGRVPPGTTMDTRARWVHELLDRLSLVDVVLLGGSMGASTAWAYLAAYGPDRVRAVVSVDQTPAMLNTADWPYGFYGYRPDNRDSYFATGIPATGHGTPLWRRGARLARLLRAMQGAHRDLGPAELALLADHARRDWRPTVADTDVPVLFVAGSRSEYWPSGHAVAAASLARRGSAAVIRGAGHATNIELPAVFNRGVLRFLGLAR